MRKRREINAFSISFLDLLSGALGAVIILYVAIPKNLPSTSPSIVEPTQELTVPLSQFQKLKSELERTKLALAEAEEKKKSVPKALDIGFKFKGKNIVFIIDTSFSMNEEGRMGEVKAGLKMLLTSMDPSYQIDIVQYPLGEIAPFKSLWGRAQPSTQGRKGEAFEFIKRLIPLGGTPTRDALLFVLRNYQGLTDIVLLTDGAPTYHNSNKKDDIYEILNIVRQENSNDIQINTIGVGSDFIQDKDSERYQFLSLLSEEHGGFFVGF